MEKFCIGRWLLLADYFQGLEQGRRARKRKGGRTGGEEEEDKKGREEAPLKYVLALDTDVASLQSPERLVSEWKLDRWAEEGREDEDEVQGGREGAMEKVLRVHGMEGGSKRKNEGDVLAEAYQVLVGKPGSTEDVGQKEKDVLKAGKEKREGKEGEKEDEVLFEAHQVVSGATMLWSLLGLEKFADFLGEMYRTREGRARVREWGFVFPDCRP
ncbi:hypothetical protein VYU27_009416 [Nannochloropsis oceanica]